MKKVLKWIGIIFAVLIGLIFIAGIGTVVASNQKANQIYDVETAVLTIPTDEASIAEGKRIIAYRGCADCHNADFSGSLSSNPTVSEIRN